MITREWCDACDSERAEYKTEMREQHGAFSTVVLCQSLCLDCLQEKRKNVGQRNLWGIRFRNIIGNAWNVEGDF